VSVNCEILNQLLEHQSHGSAVNKPLRSAWSKVSCTHLSVGVCALCRYNNQWMIVDYKRFIPGETDLKEGLFFVLEQIP